MASASNSVAAEIADGDAITLTQLAHQYRINPSTAFRWLTKGLPDGNGGRVFLVAIRRGKRWITSKAAVARFLDELPKSVSAPSILPIRTPHAREREATRSAEILKKKFGV